MQTQDYPAILLAIQIAFLGWRIDREISLGDEGRRMWFPVSDYLNVAAMISVVWFCIVRPLIAPTSNDAVITLVLSVGFVLAAMHPINIIGHYRFLTRQGRHIYTMKDKDYPYVTDHERITLIVTLAATLIVAYHSSLLTHFFSGK